MRLLVFGCGYSALRAAIALQSDAASIIGTSRTETSFQRLEDASVIPAVFNGTSITQSLSDFLRQSTHLLVSIAPQPSSPAPVPTAAEQFAGEVDPVLKCLPAGLELPNLRWIGYLSTVGVYGDWQGQWVDEGVECQPRSDRSRLRLQAETEWQVFCEERQIPLSILRLAGIYGPGRNALCNLQKGSAKRLIKPGQVFNRIHVDDIARAVKACSVTLSSGIYNVCDAEPAPPQDVVSYAAGLMGVTPPPEVAFDQAELSPMARSFYSENKRVSNRRSCELMNYQYTTYREGLSALWENGTWDNDQWLEPVN